MGKSRTTASPGPPRALSVGVVLLLLGLDLLRSGGFAQAATFALRETYRGHIRFLFTGASLTESAGDKNGVNCLRPSATVHVAAEDLPAGGELVAAILYAGGSLLDDGVDFYSDGGTRIFSTSGLRYDIDAEKEAILEIAKQSADVSVLFQPPGATDPVTITQAPPDPYVSIYYKTAGEEQGNVGFFVVRFDVTDTLVGRGAPLYGAYTVSDLQADVCLGPEAVCSDDPASICSITGSLHTNGAAAFALLLVVRDEALPSHSISVFEGLTQLFGRSETLLLQPSEAVSSPPSGHLSFFALEGDLTVASSDTGQRYCGVEEFLHVDGDGGGGATDGLCFDDDDNPRGNLFNSTINGQAARGDPPVCSRENTSECCAGDGLCGVTGVDIDGFDISDALIAGSNEISVHIGSGSDRVGLATLVLGVDVFSPDLREDTQIRALTAPNGLVRIGEPLILSIAVSNTGNVPARDVRLTFEAPAHTSDMRVLASPAGSEQITSSVGGSHATGSVTAHNFDVDPGEIRELRISLNVLCSAAGEQLTPIVSVRRTAGASAGSTDPFAVPPPFLLAGGPGVGPCDGVDPYGPLSEVIPPRVLRGGGGCRSIPPLTGAPVGLICLLLWGGRRGLRRRPLGVLLLVMVAAASVVGACHPRRVSGGTDGAAVPAVDVTQLPGSPCADWPLMAKVTAPGGESFCVDRFEAQTDGGALGAPHQGTDDVDTSVDGSTAATATVDVGRSPLTDVSWYQAKAACDNAGKRLCTLREWELACRGADALAYPYGDEIVDHFCNGFFNYSSTNPLPTGSLSTCASAWGIYDLSGNVEEWVADAVPRSPGNSTLDDRALRGGSYQSNFRALTCVGDEFHAPPGKTEPDRGFRCCVTP